jgi:hypothetical protein
MKINNISAWYLFLILLMAGCADPGEDVECPCVGNVTDDVACIVAQTNLNGQCGLNESYDPAICDCRCDPGFCGVDCQLLTELECDHGALDVANCECDCDVNWAGTSCDFYVGPGTEALRADIINVSNPDSNRFNSVEIDVTLTKTTIDIEATITATNSTFLFSYMHSSDIPTETEIWLVDPAFSGSVQDPATDDEVWTFDEATTGNLYIYDMDVDEQSIFATFEFTLVGSDGEAVVVKNGYFIKN